MSNKNQILHLPHTQLLIHPLNYLLRPVYEEKDVNEMAASIKAAKGVDQALLIAPVPRVEYKEKKLDPSITYYYTVDGNLRLTAARHLGEDAPRLKCEIVDADEQEQARIMLTTSEFYFRKTPIGRANGFRLLKEKFGLSDLEIARKVGSSYVTVQNYLLLLKLEPEIQAMIDQGFSRDPRVTRALLHIPDPKIRVETASSLFERKATIPACVQACTRIADALSTSLSTSVTGLIAQPVPGRSANGSAPQQNGSQPKALPSTPSIMTPLGAIIFHFNANAIALDAYADLLTPYDQEAVEDARDLALLNREIVAKLKEKGLEGLSYAPAS